MKSRSALAALVALLLLPGCRFYGSPETVAGAKVEISNMLAWADSEAERLAADRAALEAASLAAAAQAVSDLEGRLAGLKASWTEQAASLESSSSHRSVRRTLSGMVSERQRHEDAYARVVASLGGASPVHSTRISLKSSYWVRLEHRVDRRGIRDVLQGT